MDGSNASEPGICAPVTMRPIRTRRQHRLTLELGKGRRPARPAGPRIDFVRARIYRTLKPKWANHIRPGFWCSNRVRSARLAADYHSSARPEDADRDHGQILATLLWAVWLVNGL